MSKSSYTSLNHKITACEQCPRLRTHCRQIAKVKRAQFRDQTYFARPVPNFGDPQARVLILGLAPGAHGANRTGRMFTGDRSGDFLYHALHEAGLCNQPTSTHANDGLTLRDVLITAACHCAPPGNKPTIEELAMCSHWLDETLSLLEPRLKVVLCLGRIAMDAALRMYQRRGWIDRRAGYAFAHGAEHVIPDAPTILCSYHPSQQNTFTGRLTPAMMTDVLTRMRGLCRR